MTRPRRAAGSAGRPCIPIGARHVGVAMGRDYADVPPLEGIDVAVDMTRLA